MRYRLFDGCLRLVENRKQPSDARTHIDDLSLSIRMLASLAMKGYAMDPSHGSTINSYSSCMCVHLVGADYTFVHDRAKGVRRNVFTLL